MKARASKAFWQEFHRLPIDVQRNAHKQFVLWLSNPGHPSLQFKPVSGDQWSARVGLHHRAIAIRVDEMTFLWVWIGPHATYDRLA